DRGLPAVGFALGQNLSLGAGRRTTWLTDARVLSADQGRAHCSCRGERPVVPAARRRLSVRPVMGNGGAATLSELYDRHCAADRGTHARHYPASVSVRAGL